MSTFTAGGKTYTITLDGAAIRECRRFKLIQGDREVPLDLCNPAHLVMLDCDLPALTDALKVLCKTGDFEPDLKGEKIDAAHRAVLEAARHFFQPSVKSDIDTLCKANAMERRAMKMTIEQRAKIEEAALAKFDKATEQLYRQLSDSTALQK